MRSSTNTSFNRATFSGAYASFDWATFSGGQASFHPLAWNSDVSAGWAARHLQLRHGI